MSTIEQNVNTTSQQPVTQETTPEVAPPPHEKTVEKVDVPKKKSFGNKNQDANSSVIQQAPGTMESSNEPVFVKPNLLEVRAYLDLICVHYTPKLSRDLRDDFQHLLYEAFLLNLRHVLNVEHNKINVGFCAQLPPKVLMPITVARVISAFLKFSIKDSGFPDLHVDRTYVLSTLHRELGIRVHRLNSRITFLSKWTRVVAEIGKIDPQSLVDVPVRTPSLLTAGVVRENGKYYAVNRTKLSRTDELIVAQLRLRLFHDQGDWYTPDVVASEARAVPILTCYFKATRSSTARDFSRQFIQTVSRKA